MVTILPFQGYRYDKGKVGEFSSVVSPPYDVINAELQRKLHAASQYNVAHIIKGRKFENDTEENNEYTRAAEFLNEWTAKGVLLKDGRPSIYVLAQDFEVEGKQMTRTGFIALLKLEDLCMASDADKTCKGVHQHEETLPKDIQDRLSLLKATKANFGLIFAIYSDQEMTVDDILEKNMVETPLMTVKDDDGVTHKLWAIDDESDLKEIIEVLDNKYVIIADGHHRYKTALQYSKENPDVESAKYRMMAFVNVMNKGLVILPTHRLVQGVENFDSKKLVEALRTDFDIEEFEYVDDDKDARQKMFNKMNEMFRDRKHAFGLYCKDGKYYTLVLKDEKLMDDITGHSDAWRHLNVTILHKLILEDRLGIDKSKLASGTIEGGSYIEYIKSIGNAVQKSIDKVNEKDYQAVFFMNPTRIKEVEEVATNHETMPQKSTFFYPKVYTGFVMHRL